MLSTKAEKYYIENKNITCVEAIIYGTNDEFYLNLDKEIINLFNGFVSGM